MHTTTDQRPNDADTTVPSSDLFVDSWGTGPPVVLVHGSLATGAEEWEAQRPLADEGFRLLVPDRRGHGTPMVLVHGSLATGAEEWEAQRPLADEGFRLLVPDRRG